MMAAIVQTWESIVIFPVINQGDAQEGGDLVESGSEL